MDRHRNAAYLLCQSISKNNHFHNLDHAFALCHKVDFKHVESQMELFSLFTETICQFNNKFCFKITKTEQQHRSQRK